jgi:hypothetical protein
MLMASFLLNPLTTARQFLYQRQCRFFFELEEGVMRYKCLPCTHVQKADAFINARQQDAILSHIGLKKRVKAKRDITDPDAYGAEQPSTRPTVQHRTFM